MQIFFLSLYLTAQMLSGYHTAAAMPEVALVQEEWLQEQFCPKEKCPVQGIYGGGDIVYLSNQLSLKENPIHASMLVHEFTHFLQHNKYHFDYKNLPCTEYIKLEREAYAVQSHYLDMANVETPTLSPASFTCQ